MGDQIGVAISGTLYYVPYKEFERILSLNLGALEKTEIFATFCRINTLYMIARAGSGHIGSSFSSMDIMSWLNLNELSFSFNKEYGSSDENDIFFSSKGHDAPGLYSTWIGMGKLDFDLIHRLRRIGGLPGHPDISTPNVRTNTGSLGMGVSKAKGMIFARRILGIKGNVYVLTGDGELQEGQFWESLISASNHSLHELIVIIDHNKLQSDTFVSKVSDLGDLEAKLIAFGWHVSRCDGNNLEKFSETLTSTKKVTDKPKIIIADTIKGKGVSFMEHTAVDTDVELYRFHSGAPGKDLYVKAVQELINTANQKLAKANLEPLELEKIYSKLDGQVKNQIKLIPAYTSALMKQAEINHSIVVLDADLILDTGLIPFKKKFPQRFFECGIAEQDMVSQAGGMALQGILPIVHSFSCFLSARPQEQIYNNSTEGTKIIYVGSLAGLIPGGPGHSHQALRDICLLSSIPDLTIVEPANESEVDMLVNWAINFNPKSTYIRLTSVPVEINYELKRTYSLEKGKGITFKDGEDICIMAYGPIPLARALNIANIIGYQNIKVINMPWLNYIDENWFWSEMKNISQLIVIDNHNKFGGLYDRVVNMIVKQNVKKIKLKRISVEGIPICGENEETLAYHGMDEAGIIKKINE